MRGTLIDFQDGGDPICIKSKINKRYEDEMAKIAKSTW
jgi:hypothetical protein